MGLCSLWVLVMMCWWSIGGRIGMWVGLLGILVVEFCRRNVVLCCCSRFVGLGWVCVWGMGCWCGRFVLFCVFSVCVVLCGW